jgi:hypothetical protein
MLLSILSIVCPGSNASDENFIRSPVWFFSMTQKELKNTYFGDVMKIENIDKKSLDFIVKSPNKQFSIDS